ATSGPRWRSTKARAWRPPSGERGSSISAARAGPGRGGGDSNRGSEPAMRRLYRNWWLRQVTIAARHVAATVSFGPRILTRHVLGRRLPPCPRRPRGRPRRERRALEGDEAPDRADPPHARQGRHLVEHRVG